MTIIERSAGRSTFGGDPEKYDWARPRYPAEIFRTLRDVCGLGARTRTFEVGAGTGIASRELLAAGADPLFAVEPDPRLAAYLETASPDAKDKLHVVVAPFDEAELAQGSFDLGVSATAFHWLEQTPSLAKAHGLLRPGGWWAMCWNYYGDPERRDAFDRATRPLLAGTPRTPSQGEGHGKPEFEFDVEQRFADLRAAGFDEVRHLTMRSTFTFDTARMVALYSTFSAITHLPDDRRANLLAELKRIIDRDFGGKVERNMVSPLYLARR